MINFFLFITFAIPKAGIKLSGMPITLQILMFVLCIVICRKDILKVLNKNPKFTILYIIFCIILFFTLLLNYKSIQGFYLLVTLVLIFSPLALGIGYKANYEKLMRIMCIALILTGTYSILQWTVGIEATKIPGITIAYGDSYENKPIGFGFNEVEAIKMPSTYQNGNLVGMFYILGFACMIEWKKKGKEKYRILRIISIIMSIVGICLSGSRTAMIPFVIMIFLMILNLIIRKKIIHARALMITSILICIIFSIVYSANKDTVNRLIDRYIVQTFSDSTGSGRTTLIKELFEEVDGLSFYEKLRLTFFGLDWENVKTSEGLLYIFAFYGTIAFITSIGMFLMISKKMYKINNTIGIACFTILIAFMVDSVFNYPPILINYYIVVGAYVKKRYEELGNLNTKEDKKINN